jgi:hypothetical protein
MTLLTALGSRLRVLTSSLSSLCAAPWRTGAAVIAWLQRSRSVRTIPFRVFRPGRIRVIFLGVSMTHHRIGSMMSDRPPSRDLKTTSREIGPRANPGARPGEPNARTAVPRCEETGEHLAEGDRGARCSRPRRGGSPHRTAHAQLCAAVSGCRRVVFGYVTCHYPTPGPDPTQQKQPRIARRTILMRGGGGGGPIGFRSHPPL